MKISISSITFFYYHFFKKITFITVYLMPEKDSNKVAFTFKRNGFLLFFHFYISCLFTSFFYTITMCSNMSVFQLQRLQSIKIRFQFVFSLSKFLFVFYLLCIIVLNKNKILEEVRFWVWENLDVQKDYSGNSILNFPNSISFYNRIRPL